MYKKIDLNYDFSSLEPYIDTHTVGLHYNKYKTYLENLNKLLLKNNFKFDIPIEEVYLHINEFDEVDRPNILFNLGGVLNHELYFSNLTPKPKDYNGLEIMKEINMVYGNFDLFKKLLKDSAKKIKGSGYTFLAKNKDGRITIMNTTNQDTPLFINLKPLMALDMWEHSYYINYNNDKDEYIDAYFDILNLDDVNKRYLENE